MINKCLVSLVLVFSASVISAQEVIDNLRKDGSWKLPEKYLEDNGFRGKVVLNGFWAQHEIKKDQWKKVRIPGRSRAKGKFVLYREFKLPKGWENRQNVIEISKLKGDVKVNGKVIGSCRGKSFYEFPFAVDPAVTDYKLELTTPMLSGDVYLKSYPKPLGIKESYMQTSYRKKELKLDLEGKPGKVKVIISEAKDFSNPVKEFSGTILADGKTSLLEAWKNPKLWSLWKPNLYFYTVELLDGNGKVVDKLLPRRFGFREFWIADGQFVLNGKPVSICDDVWEGEVEKGNACRPQIEKFIDNIKKMGLTGAIRIGSETAINVTDEKGIFVRKGCGSMSKINIWDTKSGLTPMTGDENKEDIERLVKRLREHPSIISWSSSAAYALASMHPQYAGQYYNSWDHFPLNRCSGPAKESQMIFKQLYEMVKKWDPTREIASANGPFSPVETCTRYLNDDLDLQEREEFYEYWFNSGPNRKVIWASEFGTPIAGHWFIRYVDFQLPQANYSRNPKIHLENAARYFGDSMYKAPKKEDFAEWMKGGFSSTHARMPIQQKLNALNIGKIWRAWRTYGVNSSGHHVLNESGYGRPLDKTLKDPMTRFGFKTLDDPRCPGYSSIVGSGSFSMYGVDPMTPAAQSYLDATKPLMAYIGGPDRHFVSKDHLYYADSKVRKAYVVVNDLDDPAEIDGHWQVKSADGKVVAEGKLKGTVKPGHRSLTELPIEFDAPAVVKKTDYTISVTAKSNLEGKLDDTFDITVFPTHKKPVVKFNGTIYKTNISDDLTHESPHFFINRDNQEFLKNAGIDAKLIKGLKTFQYIGCNPGAAWNLLKPVRHGKETIPARKLITEGTPKPGDILLIPRHTLESGMDVGIDGRQLVQRLLEKMNMDKLVEEGLKVLVLEQKMSNIMGINAERTRPRRTFISAKGHPVFDGLDDSDLSYWTGKSNLEAEISPYSPSENRVPERLWHTSATNAVATKPLIRPQVGSCRALSVCGFDLGESPLLEVTRGKGRIIFCQYDITNRYGKDPAATRLFDNIIKYLTEVKDADPTKNSIKTAKEGDDGVTMEKLVFRGAVPEGKDGWGITQGELFFRESIYLDHKLMKKLPDVAMPVLAGKNKLGFPNMIQKDGDSFVTTLDPDIFQTGWSKRKAAWIKNALIVNQGGSTSVGPGINMQGRQTALYPYEWVEGFVHPYTFNIW